MASSGNYNFTSGRTSIPVMIVYGNGATASSLRQAVKSLGFVQVSAAASHVQGLERIRGRDFALILFDAKASDMPALDFVTAALNYDANTVLVAVSAEPRVDDVFSLLRAGARSFLVIPFTADMMESVVMAASDGQPLSDAVLQAPDRNAALVGVVLNNLYRVSTLTRQAREFPTAAKELDRQQMLLSESMDMARLFCEGGDELLLAKIIEGCINRASTSSTRLGRTRKRLQQQRAKELGVAG